MANPLAQLNTINELADLSGLFGWQMNNASYTNPNGAKVSFMVLNDQGIPFEQYIEGAVNAFNLVSGPSLTDPNVGLFNTSSSILSLREGATRKYAINRIPFANYDQLVDLGWGSQRMTFNAIFAGTMYQTAFRNVIQVLTMNDISGLGKLTHPFYQKVMNVLPIEFGNTYVSEQLNCVVCEIVFLTSDLTHLNPNSIQTNIVGEISKWYIGIQNSILSIGGTISAAKALASNFQAVI